MTSPPSHVGIIPDGTRRWAAGQNVALVDAYHQAFRKVAHMLELLWSKGVQSISVYMLSHRNLGRARDELEAVSEAEALICEKEFAAATATFDARVVVAGNLASVSTRLSGAVKALTESRTEGSRTLYLLVAYDPIAEVIESVEQLSEAVDEPIAWLTVPEPLDIVIRTSGVRSLSDFLPIQSAYAELFFLQPYVNDVTDDEVHEVLRLYTHTSRRHGL